MSRIRLTALVVSAFALGAPAAALGHGHAHHSKHHAKHQARHSHRVKTHIRRFVGNNPSAPVTTAPSDNAGTVASFTNGVLTLTLNDNSTVSGKVADTTEISCEATPQATPQVSNDFRGRASDGGGGNGGDNGGGDNGRGSQPIGSQPTGSQPSGSDETGRENQSGDDDNGGVGDNDDSTPTCDSSSLVKGAIVHEAELRIGSGGATFKKVDLVR
jgi:hypothetical protein